MIEDPTVLYLPFLVIGAFFMLFGVILGIAAANMMGSKEKKQVPGEKKVEHPGLIEVARFWREQSSGKLVVEVSEHLFRSRAELNDSLKDRLVQLIKDLREWFVPAGQQAAQPGVAAKPTAASPVKPVNPAPQAASKPVLRTEQPGNVTPPSMNMVDIVARAVTSVPAKREGTPLPRTIAGQIDAILQEKLEASSLRNRGIRLVDLPGGGIQVVVGLERFESVADVTDPEIRALIQACVAEWEKKNYPT